MSAEVHQERERIIESLSERSVHGLITDVTDLGGVALINIEGNGAVPGTGPKPGKSRQVSVSFNQMLPPVDLSTGNEVTIQKQAVRERLKHGGPELMQRLVVFRVFTPGEEEARSSDILPRSKHAVNLARVALFRIRRKFHLQ